ncbi:MAG: ABC transporter permease [Nitrospirae bacterium]|nr:ABC transporter permease [Nitrospirota bacterium]
MFSLTLKEALRSLSASKFQTFIALLGILVGVASVVGMFSIGESAKEKSLAGLKALGTDVITGSMQQSNTVMRRYLDTDILKASDVVKMSTDNKFILTSAPRISNFTTVSHSGTVSNANIAGITDKFDILYKQTIKLGRRLTQFDMEKNYCVLGYDIAGKLFGKVSDKITGKSINIKRSKFVVVGIYEKNKYFNSSDNLNECVFIPIRQAELLFESKKLTNFKAKIKEGFSADKAKVTIQDYFVRRLGLSVNVETQEMLIKQAEEQSKTSSNVLLATASISLIVGGIGIMNLMLVSVKERKREIGIRRACGAERSHIVTQFLSEAVILSTIGGILGIILGIIISLAISIFADWRPIIPLNSIVISFAASLLIGMAFGYMPARKASKIEIIDAMKME